MTPSRTPRRLALLLTVVTVLTALGSAGTATAAPGAGAQPAAKPRAGELITVRLGDLMPTQAVLGHDQIRYKLGRYTSTKDEERGKPNKKYDDWCEANGQGEAATVKANARLDKPRRFTCTIPLGRETAESLAAMKTVVVGPRGRLYLTDGHHTFTSFLEMPDGGARMTIRVRVTDNLSALGERAFWREMEGRGYVWLRDADNRPITPAQLPTRLGLRAMADDPYRSLVYFTRDIGYAKPEDGPSPEFLEFFWAGWLRTQSDLDPAGYDRTDLSGYLALIEDASRAMVALDPGTELPGSGRTAQQLGRLDAFGAKEFTSLSAPLSADKPGKVAYALSYRSTPGCR
ncbi:chromosome partitioning protein ParB [Streptomyces xiamenensis]|uniref:Chromosome partitioning protein ParB n=1 Tax=Streptomyces xiamenensis TaxID=408015 RepID=A0A0F7FY72_9ACTN|nr:ParB/Srx family N-terminal domain-containing protein [Streptomyces xiamenensis]AKG45007.1 chromosome partitioning protein ParB [Streptomyces xiamenensis]